MPVNLNTPLFLDPTISKAEAASDQTLAKIEQESAKTKKKIQSHITALDDPRFLKEKMQLLRLNREVVGCKDEPLYKAFADPKIHRMFYLYHVRAYNQIAYEMVLECDAVIKAGKTSSHALDRLNELAWELEFNFRWNTGRAQDYSLFDPYDDLDHAVDQRDIWSMTPRPSYPHRISNLTEKEIFKHLSKKMVGVAALAGLGVGAGLSLALMSSPAALPVLAAAVVGALVALTIGVVIRNYKTTAARYALEALDHAEVFANSKINLLIQKRGPNGDLSYSERDDNSSIMLGELCANSRGVTKLVYGYEWKLQGMLNPDKLVFVRGMNGVSSNKAPPATRDLVRQFYRSEFTQHVRPVIHHTIPRGRLQGKTPLQVLGHFAEQNPHNDEARILLDVLSGVSVRNTL